ncbi:MAG TPA: hypothetical protein ENN57_00945 [Chloroflexi bacterium]|nr:hypothetical protein [Chloroflexota bacterium]
MASEGYLIIGAREAVDHGHINVLRPGKGVSAGKWGLKYKSDKSALFVPESLEGNQPLSRQSLNWGWPVDVDPFSITFYEYIGNDEEIETLYGEIGAVTVTAKGSEKPQPIQSSVQSNSHTSPFQQGRLHPGDYGYLGSFWDAYDTVRNWGTEDR